MSTSCSHPISRAPWSGRWQRRRCRRCPVEQTPLYLRHGNGSFEALVTAANVETGVDFATAATLGNPDASPNFAHVVFSSRVPLTETTPVATDGGLYEWGAGHLQLVSVLPGGEPASESTLGNGNTHNMAGAVASDGNVFWKAEPEGEPHLYMFDAETGSSVQLDTVQPGATGSGRAEAVYQDAAAEGTGPSLRTGRS